MITLPSKKFLVSFLVFLIAALSIPVTVFLVKQRQELRTKAQTYTFVEDFISNNFKDNTATTAWWNNPSAPGVLQLSFSAYSNTSIQDQGMFVSSGSVYLGWTGQYDKNAGQPYYILQDYRQKLNSSGLKQWSPFYIDNRVNLHTNQPRGLDGIGAPAVVVDPQGNSYYAWNEYSQDDPYFRIKLQKYDSSGQALFPQDVIVNVGDPQVGRANGFLQAKIGRDSTGNIYVAWNDYRNPPNDFYTWTADVYLQKFDADGNRLWASDVRVTPAFQSKGGGDLDVNADSYDMAVTPSGDIYVAWDRINALGGGIYAQKVDSNGQRQWANSTKVNVSAPSISAFKPNIAWSEANQNLYVAWFYVSGNVNPIYLNKIKPDGGVAWTQDLKVNKDTNFINVQPDVAADSQGNVYVTWGQVGGVGMGQKVDPVGNFLWANDVQVAESGPQPAVDLTNNDLYIEFTRSRSKCLYAPESVVGGAPPRCIILQKFDPNGKALWANAVQVSRVGQFNTPELGQSTAVDTVDWNIASATLTAEQILNGRMDKYIPALADGTVQYYLSNDGGTTWEKVDSGVSHNFTLTGSDLRWKADLATPELSISPIVDKITIVYGQEGVTPLIPTITPTNTPTPIPTPTPTIPPGAPTPTPTPTPTPGPIVTLTPTPTPTPTMALVSTPVPTRVITLTPTPTPTPALPQAGSIAPTIGFILGGLILVGLSLLLVF